MFVKDYDVNDFSLAPSALAYLFGDVLEDVFAGKSRLTTSEKLPCRDVKVKRKDLAHAMLVSAFVYLARQGRLGLDVRTKGRIIKSKFVLVTASGGPAGPFASHEAQILGSIRGDPKNNGVRSIVWRLWGADVGDPWGDLIRDSQRYLLGLGYFVDQERRGIAKIMGKKLMPNCERTLTLRPEATPLRNMLAAFRAEQPELYERLWKEVAAGIASRQESPDVDFD